MWFHPRNLPLSPRIRMDTSNSPEDQRRLISSLLSKLAAARNVSTKDVEDQWLGGRDLDAKLRWLTERIHTEGQSSAEKRFFISQVGGRVLETVGSLRLWELPAAVGRKALYMLTDDSEGLCMRLAKPEDAEQHMRVGRIV